MEEEKKLGLGNVISVSMGLVLATSCLVSLGQGAGEIGATFIISMVIACVLNMFTMLSLAELNALMPNITGGLAQYTLAAMGPFPTIIVMVGSTMVISIVSSGAPAFGIVFLTIGIIIFALLSQNSADAIDFFILVCSIFGMMSYLFSHIGVLVFCRKLPKAYRSFRVPTAVPVIGCIGLIYMTFNISPDPAEKLQLLICAGGLFAVYAVYASLWIKFKWKTKIFRSVPIEEVMAMEDDRYYQVRIVRGIWR